MKRLAETFSERLRLYRSRFDLRILQLDSSSGYECKAIAGDMNVQQTVHMQIPKELT